MGPAISLELDVDDGEVENYEVRVYNYLGKHNNLFIYFYPLILIILSKTNHILGVLCYSILHVYLLCLTRLC